MIVQGKIIPVTWANLDIKIVPRCSVYYIISFTSGNFQYEDELRCYERGGHTDAHKTRLTTFEEDGGVIYWNNFKTLKCDVLCEGQFDCKQGFECPCGCHK